MADNSVQCNSNKTFKVKFNGLPLINGDVCSIKSDFDEVNLCVTINNSDLPDGNYTAQTEYNNCYECLSENQGIVTLADCFEKREFDVTLDGLGVLPNDGDYIYVTINTFDGQPSDAITSCFRIVSSFQTSLERYNEAILDGKILIPQLSATTQSDCPTCLANNLFSYSVVRCTDGSPIDYVVLPDGLQDHLISYSDGTDQYCGVVEQLENGPTSFVYVSDFGLLSGSVTCDTCLEVANEKVLIQSCTNSDIQEVVWASALFENGDVSNLSNNDGCFEVVGLTTSGVTIDSFLNFEPQPGCNPCIECSGINYEYQTCSSILNLS